MGALTWLDSYGDPDFRATIENASPPSVQLSFDATEDGNYYPEYWDLVSGNWIPIPGTQQSSYERENTAFIEVPGEPTPKSRIRRMAKVDQAVKRTIFPQSATVCPVAQTTCPAKATTCVQGVATACPNVAVATSRPLTFTQCSAVHTQCPDATGVRPRDPDFRRSLRTPPWNPNLNPGLTHPVSGRNF